jgi:hypothetical protein
MTVVAVAISNLLNQDKNKFCVDEHALRKPAGLPALTLKPEFALKSAPREKRIPVHRWRQGTKREASED